MRRKHISSVSAAGGRWVKKPMMLAAEYKRRLLLSRPFERAPTLRVLRAPLGFEGLRTPKQDGVTALHKRRLLGIDIDMGVGSGKTERRPLSGCFRPEFRAHRRLDGHAASKSPRAQRRAHAFAGVRVGEAAHPGPVRVRRAPQDFRVVTLNSNAWSTARTWLQLHTSQPQIVLLQEHRLADSACLQAQHSARRDGWRVGLAAAAQTERSTSAGVAVAVPIHIGMEPRRGRSVWNASPSKQPGRIASAWVNILGGVTVFTVYMHCSAKWDEQNVDLFRHLAQQVRQVRGLWVVGGDFNMTPAELQGRPVRDELDGTFVAPDRGTCWTTGGWKLYDYFIVHPKLRYHVKGVQVDTNAPTAPHLPVVLSLCASVPNLVQRVPVMPKPLPQDLPHGCSRPPPLWPTLPLKVGDQTTMDEIWTVVIRCIEREVLDRADIVGEQAEPHHGREHPAQWVRRPVKPARSATHLADTAATRVWSWLERRLKELKCIINKHGFGDTLRFDGSVLRQFRGLQKSFFQYIPMLKPLGDCARVWSRRLRLLSHFATVTLAVRLDVDKWYEEVRGEADQHEKKDKNQRRLGSSTGCPNHWLHGSPPLGLSKDSSSAQMRLPRQRPTSGVEFGEWTTWTSSASTDLG